jgi:hypothetical protein
MPRLILSISILTALAVPLAARQPRAAEADARFGLRDAHRLGHTDPP